MHSLRPYQDFVRDLPPKGVEAPTLASPSDLYSVLTVLHIEDKASTLHWNPHGGFYYFIASFEEAIPPEERATAQAGPGPAEATTENGEAPPGENPGRGGGAETSPTPGGGASRDQSSNSAGGPSESDARKTGYEAVEPSGREPGPAAGSSGAATDPSQQAAVVSPPTPSLAVRRRTQILVPISSDCSSLTPRLLARLFSIRGVSAQQLLLALVDGNGVVSRTCLFNYIQAPLEGPGTADLELLDD